MPLPRIKQDFPMRKIIVAALVALPLLSANSWAQEAADTMERPSMEASRSVMVSAVVEAINHETRVVTVRKEDGEALTFTASEEARNLGQVSVGDILVAEYIESLAIQVFPNNGMEPEAAAAAAMARTEEGDMPGFAAMEQTIIVTTLESVNLENNTFKLKLPDGSINEYTARVPENLRRVVVGDLVVITLTDGVAIAVEKKAAN
jgi:translation initiation factor IF-1